MKIYIVQLQDDSFINKEYLITPQYPLSTTNKIENAKQWKSEKTARNFIKSYKEQMGRFNQEPKILHCELIINIKEVINE